MPALQNLSLDDRASAAHAFTPRDVKNGVGLVVANAGVPAGEERLTISMKKSGSRFRGNMSLAVPVVATETINGVSKPTVLRTAYVDVTVTFDETSTETERTNIIGMLADALGTSKTLVHNTFVNLEGVYGS
jgi:hypothetical protein